MGAIASLKSLKRAIGYEPRSSGPKCERCAQCAHLCNVLTRPMCGKHQFYASPTVGSRCRDWSAKGRQL